QPERLPDGSYRISCNAPLTSCLQALEQKCEWHGYDVISASETRSRHDLRDIPDVAVKSDAKVRCKAGEPLVRAARGAPAPPPAPPPPPPPAPRPRPPRPPPPPPPPQTRRRKAPPRRHLPPSWPVAAHAQRVIEAPPAGN